MIMQKLQAVQHTGVADLIDDRDQLRRIEPEYAAVASGIGPLSACARGKLHAQPDIRPDSQRLAAFYNDRHFAGHFHDQNAFDPELRGVEPQVNELFILVTVADETRVRIRHISDCGDEFGFASRLESVMEFASEAGNFLDHLLLLIDLDRVDPAVLSGIIRLLDRFTETGVQKPYLRIQNISEAEKNRHIHAAFLNAVHNFHETDRRSLRTESRHNEFSLVIDVKVSGAPVLDSVKIRGIAGCPMFESVFMNVHSRVVPPTFKSLPDYR